MDDKKIIYLDCAASTPVDSEIAKAMLPYFSEIFANPSSTHLMGQRASRAIDEARTAVAGVFKSQDHEVIFTPSATSANNLAIRGIIENGSEKRHIITSAFEHESVLGTVHELEKQGIVDVTYVTPTSGGFIRPEDVALALRDNTVLVSIMYVNNEIGTIQPIIEIAEAIKDHRSIFHTDAVQAAQFLDLDVGKLGVDLMTISAHKIYGPKGSGVLYKRNGIKLAPLVYGGGQEEGLVSGTENVATIVGMAKALEFSKKNQEINYKKIQELRDYLWEQLQKDVPCELNGSLENRLPNNLNILIKKQVDPDVLRLGLSQAGIAVSFGSACTAHMMKPSHTLMAIGRTHEEAMRSFRISLGKYTKKEELDRFVETLLYITKS